MSFLYRQRQLCLVGECCKRQFYTCHVVASYVNKRFFFSGVSEKQLKRLMRATSSTSILTGRGVLSDAFESRLRVLPLHNYRQLYDDVNRSICLSRRHSNPYSSSGNLLQIKHYCEGDEMARKIIEQKQQREQAAEQRRQWTILVVDPLSLENVDNGITFPSPHPLYYQQFHTHRANEGYAWYASNGGINNSISIGKNEQHEACYKTWPRYLRKHLRKNAHTALINEKMKRHVLANNLYNCHSQQQQQQQQQQFKKIHQQQQKNVITARFNQRQSNNDDASGDGKSKYKYGKRSARKLNELKQLYTLYYHISLCVEPNLQEHYYTKDEAQVQLITAYRNILYEAAELAQSNESNAENENWQKQKPQVALNGKGKLVASISTTTASSSSSLSQPSTQSTQWDNMITDVVRIPVLGCYTGNTPILEDIAKLTQRSVIKGFHRLDRQTRERIMSNPMFTLELYTPPSLYSLFVRTFAEEAWPAPQNTLQFFKIYYPGLPPPRTLLECDGWLGKRPQLIEAIETRGLSLLTKPQLSLDGSTVTHSDVMAQIRPGKIDKEIQDRIEREKQTASKMLLDFTEKNDNTTKSSTKHQIQYFGNNNNTNKRRY